MSDRIETITKAICRSGKFETGEGTCAVICMSHLGSARKGCSYHATVHRKLAEHIADALDKAEGQS